MLLEVRLFDGLVCNNPELGCAGEHVFEIEVPEGITLKELHGLLHLNSPFELINMVNGKAQEKNWILEHKDRVGIFPPSGGG